MATSSILYTRHDGGVTICHPAPDCLKWLSNGGHWKWLNLRRWTEGLPPLDLEEQVERSVAAGHREHAVRRYIKAMGKGGCTTAEALDIIRDRDCSHLGTAHELVAPEELPDRWFRDAWRRSHNGGPLSIDIRHARKIQFSRIKAAAEAENRRRSDDLDLFDAPLAIPFGAIRDRLRKAETEQDLRRIWPENLAA